MSKALVRRLQGLHRISYPALQSHRFHPGWHRHRTVLADTAPRLLGGMGLRRGPRRATDTRTEWPANETGSQTGLFPAI